MLDLQPATSVLARLVEGTRDDQLTAPTPCQDMTVGDLLDHVDGLSLAFTAAATKAALSRPAQGRSADASRLGPDWRSRIPVRLSELAMAWKDPAAWEGMTRVIQDMPGDAAGLVALDEVVIHGWDLAMATGQRFGCEPELIQAVFGFVRETAERYPGGTPGLFGPPVPVSDDAPLFDRILGMAGRDPHWPPSTE